MMSWTIENLIEYPKRSSALINGKGDFALLTLSQYSIEADKTTGGIYVLETETGQERCIVDTPDARDPRWINDTSFLYLIEQDKKTSLLVGDIRYANTLVVYEFNYPILKLLYHKSGTLAFLVKVGLDAEPLSYSQLEKLDGQKVLAYETGPLRCWDKWNRDFKYAILTSKLIKSELGYSLTTLLDVVTPRGLILDGWQTPLDCPIDISAQHIAFMTRDPSSDGYITQAYQIWQVTLDGSDACKVYDCPSLCLSVAYSPEGNLLAFSIMLDPNNLGDIAKLILYKVQWPHTLHPLCADWDRSVDTIFWHSSKSILYLGSEDRGQNCIFQLDISRESLAPQLYAKNAIFISTGLSGTTLCSGSSFFQPQIFASNLRDLSPDDPLFPSESVTEEYTTCEDREIHSFLIRPAKFDPSRKYPLIVAIHGGPQAAWTNAWLRSTNVCTIANQDSGYIVLLINPTGSTSYGQKFSNDIKKDWGGAPFDEISATVDQTLEKYSFIDANRCIAMGGSYGGYMMYWIQGHDYASRFKAIVCECGVADLYALTLASDRAWFLTSEFGGSPFGAIGKSNIDKFNPIQFAKKWKVPQLIVHGANDFRVCETQAMAAYAILQANGTPCRFVHFEDEFHNVVKPASQLRRYREIMSWIERWTKA
jgi:acetyl esterase/lipase